MATLGNAPQRRDNAARGEMDVGIGKKKIAAKTGLSVRRVEMAQRTGEMGSI